MMPSSSMLTVERGTSSPLMSPFMRLRTAWVITFGTLGLAQLGWPLLRPGQVSGSQAKAVGAGVLLATPLVLVFGALFASADPVFNSAVSFVFHGALGPAVSHTLTAGALAWASAGYLWTLAKPPKPQPAGTQQSYTLPTHQRYVAIRAIDDVGNVGWDAQLDTE